MSDADFPFWMKRALLPSRGERDRAGELRAKDLSRRVEAADVDQTPWPQTELLESRSVRMKPNFVVDAAREKGVMSG